MLRPPQNFISLSTFRDILNLRSDYLTALSDVGFVPFRASPSAPALNENSTNENLLKAIIFAGTGRLVKIRLPPTRFDKVISGTVERERLSKEVKYYERESTTHPIVLSSRVLTSSRRSRVPPSWLSTLRREPLRHSLHHLLLQTRHDQALPPRRD